MVHQTGTTQSVCRDAETSVAFVLEVVETHMYWLGRTRAAYKQEQPRLQSEHKASLLSSSCLSLSLANMIVVEVLTADRIETLDSHVGVTNGMQVGRQTKTRHRFQGTTIPTRSTPSQHLLILDSGSTDSDDNTIGSCTTDFVDYTMTFSNSLVLVLVLALALSTAAVSSVSAFTVSVVPVRTSAATKTQLFTTASAPEHETERQVRLHQDRRSFLGSAVTAVGSILALATATATTGAQPAFADVSDGNALPDGAARFAKLVRVKSDIPVSWIQPNVETVRRNVAYVV